MLAVALPLAAAGTNVAVANTPHSLTQPRTATAPRVLHRVVWADATPHHPGIRLSSARVDGSGVRHIFSTKRGSVLYLSLDRKGRRVAFAPWNTWYDSHPLPVLEVASVLGGKVWRPLASYPSKFDWVIGIGWSPSGRRLAFEGGTFNADGTAARTSALWTVRLNGTGLHRVMTIPQPSSEDSPLAWTRQGILYVNAKYQLRVARQGASHLVLRHVLAVRISGNGQHIVTWRGSLRAPGYQSIWYSDPDGSHRHRIARWPLTKGTPPPGTPPGYFYATPNYDGSRILAERDIGPFVSWREANGPDTASEIAVVGANYPATWN